MRQPGWGVMLLFWTIVLAAGAWLRLWQIDLQILIDDEWHALHRLMHAGYSEIFLSFGHADYSIPLTLLFRALADTVGLHEWHMRLLPMAFGLAAMVVLPALLKPWLRAPERLCLAALVAVSPLLIHFSRFVRPYALVVVLGFAAVILLWQWWHRRGKGRAAGFFLCAVAAAWLHPLTTIYTGVALTWFAVAGIRRWRGGDGHQAFRQVLGLGAITTLACSALILPPLVGDTASIAAKTGKHAIELETLARSWEMMFGLGNFWLAAVLVLPVAYGARILWSRDRLFLCYWLAMTAVAFVIIQFLGPEWIRNALVLVRYTVLTMPIVLALLAVGLVGLAGLAVERLQARPAWLPALALAAVAALFLAGPLPKVYSGINQFTNSARYQIDYNLERSIFDSIMSPIETPEFYRRIAETVAREPEEWQVVEAAWHFESHFTPMSQYQRDHQLPLHVGMIGGLCADWTYGELRPDSDLEIELDRFVFLTDILREPRGVNRFVVFPLDYPFDYEPRELPDLGPCIEAFREQFGPPWHESDDYIVFRVPASDPEDGV